MLGYFSKTEIFWILLFFCALGGEEKASAPFNLGHGEGDNFTSFDPIFFPSFFTSCPIFAHQTERSDLKKLFRLFS